MTGSIDIPEEERYKFIEGIQNSKDKEIIYNGDEDEVVIRIDGQEYYFTLVSSDYKPEEG